MGPITEAVQTNERPDTATHNGVVCIFCGLPTPVQTSREGAATTNATRSNHRVSIIRCEICGKEAPYPAHEIAEFGGVFHEPSSSLWFAKEAA